MLPLLAEIVWDKQTLAVVFGCSIPIIAIIAGSWFSIEKMKSNNALKRDMIGRGMSAEEIQAVLSAEAPKNPQDEEGSRVQVKVISIPD